MGKRVVVESGRDRRALVADAGWSQLSVMSVLAGVLVAYGAFALLAGIAGGILDATDADTDISARWDDLGVFAGLVVAVLLLLSYLFGGYVAGRMARRAGVVQGLAVFVLGVVVAAVVAVAVRQLADTDAIADGLRDLGLPTTGDEWGDVGTVAGLASLAGALIGALLGGLVGERWHAKLLSRAVDPDVGAEADARRTAEVAAAEARVRHTESQERADTASLRGLRDAPADRRPDANGGGTTRTGWYRRDPALDDVPERQTARSTDDATAPPTQPTVTEDPGPRREKPVQESSDRSATTGPDEPREGGIAERVRRTSRGPGRPGRSA